MAKVKDVQRMRDLRNSQEQESTTEKVEDREVKKTSNTSAELLAEAEDLSKHMTEMEEKFAEAKARRLAEIAKLREEAKKAAEAEAEAKKAEEAERAAQVQKIMESKRAAKAQESLEANTKAAVDAPKPKPAKTGMNGPAKVYEYYDPELKRTVRTSDVWAAIQAAPGRWKGVWVMYEDGAITRPLTSSEIQLYLPA